jgi:uncharacterized protein (DUF2252 family)
MRRLRAFNAGLTPKRRRGKYLAMSLSPFTFFRGTDHLYWDDVGTSPELALFSSPKTQVWLSGDLHLGNIGITGFAPSSLTYDLNDFDESVVADYQLDLWRLAISVILVARQQQLSRAVHKDLINALVAGYVDVCATARARRGHPLPVSAATACGPIRRYLRTMAASQSYATMLERWTEHRQGERVLAVSTNQDLALPTYPVMQHLAAAAGAYAARLPRTAGLMWPPLSIARRLHAGIGSYGVPRFYLLVRGRTGEELRILDVKGQSVPSAWGRMAPASQAKTAQLCRGNHALRVVIATQALSAQVEPLLGWMPALDQVFSVRERTPFKGTLPDDALDAAVVRQLGQIAADAHVRSHHRHGAAVLSAIAAADQPLERHVYALASTYAEQVDLDYQSVRTHLCDGTG